MKLPFRKSIKFKLALLVLTIIPIGMTHGIITSNMAKNKISQKNKESLELRSRLFADKIEKILENDKGILKSVSSLPAIIDMDANRQKILLTNIIDNYHHIYRAMTVGVDGMNIARSDHRELKYLGDRQYVQDAIKGRDISYETIFGRTSGKLAVCMGRGTVDRNDSRVTGALVICSYLQQIVAELGSLRFGETGYAMLVDRKGQVLAHPNPAFQVSNDLSNLADFPPVRNLLENGAKDLNFVDELGQHWVSRGTRLQNGWSAITIISRNEFLSEGHEISETMLLFEAGTAVILALFIWGLGNHLIAPITQLNKTAQAISKGKYAQLRINRTDEFGRLALSLNQMIKTLFTVNSQLEKKVAQRTSELKLESEKLTLALQVAKANERKVARFVQNLVHQTSFPINAILARSNDRPWKNQTTKECTLYLKSILDNLVDCKKKKIIPKCSEVNLRELINVVIDTVQSNLKNQVILQSQLPLDLPVMIETDPSRLLQVLFNLLSNSVKFTSIGSITFNLKCVDFLHSAHILFQIKDTGSPLNIRNDNFLRNAREILKALGSQLKVQNHDTAGVSFEFELSVEKNKTNRCLSNCTSIKGYLGEKKTILLAEENQKVSQDIQSVLSPLGFKIVTVTNGEEGRNYLKENKDPDLVIADMFLQHNSGLFVMELLRERGDIPAIVTSEEKEYLIFEKALKWGASGFLSKSFAIEDLLFYVQKTLKLTWTDVQIERTPSKPKTQDVELRSHLVQPLQEVDRLKSEVESVLLLN